MNISRSPEPAPRQTIAVIGAGVAGLACARILVDGGHRVTLFDKGRRPGGRVSTRRGGPFAFDHGAQYFTIENDALPAAIANAVDDGVVAPWDRTIVSKSRGNCETPGHCETINDGRRRWVGTPGMSALPRHMSAGLDVRCARAISGVTRNGAGWRLTFEDGSVAGEADMVVIAVPAPQAAALLAGSPDLANRAAATTMAPCWAVMLGFEEPLTVPYDGAFVGDSPVAWIARDRSKPGRGGGESWVVHASPEWSRKHLEAEHREIVEDLRDAFGRVIGQAESNPAYVAAHRWRYARVEVPAGDACLFDSELGIGACGDWCLGGKIESALASGQALADRIIHSRIPVLTPERA